MPQPPHVHGQSAERVAQKDTEVGKHARKVSRPDDRTAIIPFSINNMTFFEPQSRRGRKGTQSEI